MKLVLVAVMVFPLLGCAAKHHQRDITFRHMTCQREPNSELAICHCKNPQPIINAKSRDYEIMCGK